MRNFLFVAILFISQNFLAEAKTVKITGYNPGEFAVKGKIAELLDREVAGQLREELKRTGKSSVEIIVVGYADKTGISADNDWLGKARAEEVKSVLMQKLPDAKILAITKGDESDVRMVSVEWKIKSLPLKSREKQSKNDMMELKRVAPVALLLILFSTLVLVIALIVFPHKRAKGISHTGDYPGIISVVEVSDGQTTYLVPFEKKDSKLCSVIPIGDISSQKFVHGDSLGDLKRFLHNDLHKKPEVYRTIYADLAKRGIIRIKKGSEK